MFFLVNLVFFLVKDLLNFEETKQTNDFFNLLFNGIIIQIRMFNYI